FASTSLRCSYRYSPIDAPAPSELYTLSLHDALPILPVSVRASRRDRDPPAAARRHPLPDPVLRHLSRVDRGDLDAGVAGLDAGRSEEHTSELQSRFDLVCRLLLEKKKKQHQVRRMSI